MLATLKCEAIGKRHTSKICAYNNSDKFKNDMSKSSGYSQQV